SIHEDLHGALEDYDGDNAPLGDLAFRLAPCIKQQVQPRERRLTFWLWAIPLAILFALGWWYWLGYRDDERVGDYLEELRAEPGIVVTGANWSRGKWHITGLRDPLSTDPRDVLLRTQADAALLDEHWEPYAALNPAIVLKRLRASLPI